MGGAALAVADGGATATKTDLKGTLGELYQRLAQISRRARDDAPEQRAQISALLADVEAIDRRIERLFDGDPRVERAAPSATAEPSIRERRRAGALTTGAGDRFKVLFVEDDEETQLMLSRLFAPHFEVAFARDGLEGARAAREQWPDAVITDLCMPQVDGYTLLSALRCDEETSHIPLLVLSALTTTEAKVRAFEAGAFDYVTKPASAAEVVARVRNAMAHAAHLQRERMLQATDDLTGLFNRRWLRTVLTRALRHAARSHTGVTVLMVDQNGLKQVNDRHGHAVGDEAIKAVARALTRSKRGTDTAARIGGDEFVVVLPETDRTGAATFIARFEEELARNRIPVDHGEPIALTASFGMACTSDVAWEEDCDQILLRADLALYERKRDLQGLSPVLATG